MTKEKANKELDKCNKLKGKTSIDFNSVVQDVFVGPNDPNSVSVEYGGINGTYLFSKDATNNYIVWAKFDNMFIPAHLVRIE